MKMPELKGWILRKLGHPRVTVNIDDSQMYDRIMEAVDKFMKHHVDGSHREYFILNLTKGLQSYTLPDRVYAITNIYKASGIYPNLDMMQIVFSDLYRNGKMFRVDPADWAILQSKLSLIKSVFEKTLDFEFNVVQHRLNIVDSINEAYAIAIEAYAFDDIDDHDTGDESLQNILSQEWVRDYALSLCKEQWGVNLEKFKNMAFIGNVSVDPTKMIDDAQKKQAELVADLNEKYGGVDPVYFG